MHFPFGPFRNAGDFRLWIVASVLWLAVSSFYCFYLDPPSTRHDADADLPYFRAVATCVGSPDPATCVENEQQVFAREAVREEKRQLWIRLGIIALPPFAVVGMIWLVIGSIEWVRRGYAG